MIKLYYWYYRNSNPTPKEQRNNLILVKKTHDQNLVIIRQGNQKCATSFRSEKHDYAFI
ncbi:hypothetical protein [Spiroplasma poulsonii]|uniref:hypothetical protein n=1 Tax=Spiroplasma poulsonii TaxID=2138 RepID=UPI001F4D1CCC|nr:hypothetical protein [Spiroplasma poulsonii]UNF62092.1 hypothetical protein MNU24_01100 [Spiroplasma poulsonii]